MNKEELLDLVNQKENLFLQLSNCYNELDKERIYSKIYYIDAILYRHRNELEENPIKEGKRVDLYKYILNGEGMYAVCLHGTKDIVGYIEYRGEIKLHKDSFGNIGYETFIDSRRKGYMIEALRLLAIALEEQGIEKVYISANKNNVPSLKLAEKFGGKLLKKYSNTYYVYECDLKMINSSISRR